ncbi:PREDICTED: hematopoietic prostaglandin D synthase [Chrysochloris asiatica]|uniref:glutathione transferase n=1 Tax=Chrysochloris asiatica TaxID=185453 RepID=A0A9B0U759_CHRAS|nr:PREDICTED: hematopoietic prostaglandin D synthase [Chrysochloris asiatica]
MPNYKLTYFNMRGRAEIIRYIFAYLDINYEDHRIEQADWPEIKSILGNVTTSTTVIAGFVLLKITIFGKMTRLATAGTDVWKRRGNKLEPSATASDSMTMVSFSGAFVGSVTRLPTLETLIAVHGCNLSGKTDLEQCQVDAIVDTLDDFMSRFPWAEKKKDVKEKMFNELLTCDAPILLQDLDTYLGKKEWFVGNSVTWADFYWDVCSTTLLAFKSDLLDIHPRLVTLQRKVQAIPAIADWIQRRPQTKL